MKDRSTFVEEPASRPVRSRDHSGRVKTVIRGESRTKRSFQAESDINTIVAKYLRDGVHPRISNQNPRWGDFSRVGDFRECMQRVAEAERLFMQLPADVRSACRNDPGELIGMLETPEGLAELRELGVFEETDGQEKISASDTGRERAGHGSAEKNEAGAPEGEKGPEA